MSLPCLSTSPHTCAPRPLFFSLPLRLVGFLIWLGSISLTAQDLSTPLLSESWQATFSNPALYGTQRGRFTVGLPGLRNDFVAENVTYNQLLREESGRRIVDLNRIVGLLDERNEVGNELAAETLGLAGRGDRFSWGISHRWLASGQVDYPKELIQVIAEGNEQFIGQTVEIAPFGIGTTYHEFALGGSYAITDRVILGGRVKYLNGVADVRVGRGASLRLTTGEENFALTLDQDLTLNSSNAIAYEDLGDISPRFNDFEEFATEGFFGENNGFAFDLGVFVDLDRVRIQAAANNLGGSIRWREEVENLAFSGSDSFSGLDVLDRIFTDTVSFTDALDSLETTFAPTSSAAAYEASVGQSYLAGGEFDVTERLTAGLLVVHYARRVRSETALALNARYRLLNFLAVGLNYNARRGKGANLGGQLYLTAGPVQLLASTDNLPTVLNQRDHTRASVRIGAALSFGYGRGERADDD